MPGTTNGFAGTPPIRLKIDKLRAAARRNKWTTDKELASALQVSPASLSRILNTDEDGNPLQNPGETFIARILTAFPGAKFEDFFEVGSKTRSRTNLRRAS